MIIAATLLLASVAHSEDSGWFVFEEGDNRVVEITLVSGRIFVYGVDSDTVRVTTTPMSVAEGKVDVAANQPADPRASGMRRLTYQQTGLAVRNVNNVMSIATGITAGELEMHIYAPREVALHIESSFADSIVVDGMTGRVTVRGGNKAILISNSSAEIEVDSGNAWIYLQNISGSVVANTTFGSIEASFASLDPEKPVLLSAIGHIDITLPPEEDASLFMKSTWGEVYSDFDDLNLMPKELEEEVVMASGTVEADVPAPLAPSGGRVQSSADEFKDEDSSDEKKKASPGKLRAPAAAPRADNSFIRGKIGKGGAEIRLVTASGNIYVRRSK